MTIQRLSVATGVDPENAGGGDVTNGALALNALYAKYPDGRYYATQRPALSLREIAENTEETSKAGRGIVYWDAIDVYYFVNDNKVYQGGYSSPLSQEISHGRDPVTFVEVGVYLVILDRENNEGWYIDASSPTTLTQITDANFPGNIANVEIAGGGANLNGTLYVMDTEGNIYGSDINDPTTWDALNVIVAQREQDTRVFLTLHHDHLVAIGTKSIEFFFDAANPVGSALERRSDVSYRVGTINPKSVFNTGDRIYFVGSERTGTIGVYQLVQFSVSKVSGDAIDTYLSVTRSRSKFDFIVGGCTVGDHQLIFITSVAPGIGSGWEGGSPVSINIWLPKFTLVYDGTNDVFIQFMATIAGITEFPVIGATERSAVDERETSLIFPSGDIGFFDLTFARLDSAGSQEYVDPDYIVDQDDYIQDIGQELTSRFPFVIRFGETDFGMITNKFGHRMSVVGTTTSASASVSASPEPIYVQWSDDHYLTWSSLRPLETGLNRSLTRLGTFKRRAHQLLYFGEDILRIEALEMDVRASQYA